MTTSFFGNDYAVFEQALKDKGHAPFRVKQIADWVWSRGVTDVQKMENLPKDLRQDFSVLSMTCDLRLESTDGTIKRRLKLANGEMIETVSIPIQGQWTVCVSSQTGCAMGCQFCATGLKKKFVNLTGREIAEQALWHWSDTGEKPGRIVFMGMGEPLSNRKGVGEAIDLLTGKLGMSGRRLTVSTVGMLEGVQWLAERKPAVNLALSLHSAIDTTRKELVPTARSSVRELVTACKEYRDKTGRDITFELVLLKDVNDSREHAEALVQQAGKGINVNLIAYNPGGAGEFESPPSENIRAFCAVLKNAGVNYTVRTPRGRDINAACGELTIKTS